MSADQAKPKSRRPRTGERRRWRQPLKADLLSEAARTFVKEARTGRCVCQNRAPHFHTWMELEALSPVFAGQRISHSALHRWHDIRVEQNVSPLELAIIRECVEPMVAKLFDGGRTQLIEDISDRVVDKLRAGPRRVA